MSTIRDVAAAAGVSPATVSYVVNNGPRPVKDSTRLRVLRAMKDLGYFPNAVARGLQGKRMNTVGVVIPHTPAAVILDDYYAMVLEGIVSGSVVLHQTIMLFAGDYWADPFRSIPVLGDGRCDGLIVLVPQLADELVRLIAERGIPLVVVGERTSDPSLSSVESDHNESLRLLVGHIASLGHRRIAFINGGYAHGSSHDRVAAFLEAMEHAGIEILAGSFLNGEYSRESGYGMCRQLMLNKEIQRPTAIICASDSLALGTLEALRELGVAVPEAISVVGIDDVVAARSSVPQLTTVSHNLKEQGERAVSMLVGQVERRSPTVTKWIQYGQLIVRGSTAPPHDNA